MFVATLAIAIVGGVGLPTLPAYAATTLSGVGFATNGGTNYAKSGTTITVTVNDAGSACVKFSSTDFTTTDVTSGPDFVFDFPAPSGTGVKSVRTRSYAAAANPCTGNSLFDVTTNYTLDNTAPAISWVGGPAAGGTYTPAELATLGTPTCTATDTGGSGVNSLGCVVTNYGTSAGPHTMTATAIDKVGNSTPIQRSYTVSAVPDPATLAGGAGTYTSGGTVYARSGQTIDVTVPSLPATLCASATGTGVPAGVTNDTTSPFSFSFGAVGGDETKAVTTSTFNLADCSGTSTRTTNLSYVADNTAPSGISFSDAAWNSSYVFGSVPAQPTCSATTDTGSGVA
ncbi:MAG TPA: hypothetical protein VNA30_00655, partial [Mycobacteriales bacterium]|nr:hypothetical protein [Mycobacteriales bacterium]